MAGLKWANIDLERGVVRVVETRVVVWAKVAASTPKTVAGRRAIRLDDRLVAELKSHRAPQARDRLATGSAWEVSDHLFVDELGRPYRPETLSRKFAKLTADAG